MKAFHEFSSNTVRETGLILLFDGEVDRRTWSRLSAGKNDRQDALGHSFDHDEHSQTGILTSGLQPYSRLPGARPVAVGICSPLQWRNRPRFTRGSQAFDCGDGWTTHPSFFKERIVTTAAAAICQEKFLSMRAKGAKELDTTHHAAGRFPLPTMESEERVKDSN